MSFSAASLLKRLMQLPTPERYWVCYSGGRDSHVLLHAMANLHSQLPCQHISAVHVNHGLHQEAEQWVSHCATTCQNLNIPLTVLNVDASAPPGESPEAAARNARYAALHQLINKNEMLLTAHHHDDQAETVLLQLLRGSGVKGLAAMPAVIDFETGWLARPLLPFARSMLQHYAEHHNLQWIEDSSNRDTTFNRNYIRHEVIPVIQNRWPSLGTTMLRVAANLAEAARLLDDLARMDWESVKSDTGKSIALSALKLLEPDRQRNVLRFWIVTVCGLPSPNAKHLQLVMNNVIQADEDAEPLVNWPGAEVRRYQDDLFAFSPLPRITLGWEEHWDLQEPLELPSQVTLICEQTKGLGLSESAIAKHGVEVRFRRGGETCRLPGRSHHHSLKKLFQEWHVPPWERERVPLIFIGDTLAQVVGYSLCEPYSAKKHEPGLTITADMSKTSGSVEDH